MDLNYLILSKSFWKLLSLGLLAAAGLMAFPVWLGLSGSDRKMEPEVLLTLSRSKVAPVEVLRLENFKEPSKAIGLKAPVAAKVSAKATDSKAVFFARSSPVETPKNIVSSPEFKKSAVAVLPPTLWELEEKLKRDPKRELLVLERNWGQATVHFYEISPGGLVSFEVVNQGTKDIFLPSLECANCQSGFEVYWERRVIEPGVRSLGIAEIKDLSRIKELKLEFKAANRSSKRITLEVPKWFFL